MSLALKDSIDNAITFFETEQPLWMLFNRYVTAFTDGKFIPNKFSFIVGKVPISNLSTVLSFIGGYYVVIFGGQYLLKGTSPLKLNALFQLHNLFLTTVSLVTLLLLLEQLIPIIYKQGIFYAICNAGSWTQPIVTLYYLNYLIKYVEFIDTVFLVLKKKPLTFLHTYHHGATAMLCYTELVGFTAISWVPITLNLAVHVLMYWYYFLSARGIKVWWKKWITRCQILQFVLDLTFIYFATYQKFVHSYKINLPYCGDCFGSITSNLSGSAILSSYLFLFTAFYIENYKRKRSAKHVLKDKKAT
ncbi:Fatty acyl-CoA elongase/Polyunsaturated fatty acid specific elongation enzyme [Monosporozyma unispora]|nr:Fatty acyl-CoA elongase/Polyunsaturated fatty acid specific elongation enzyme [Kazachstania unispora]